MTGVSDLEQRYRPGFRGGDPLKTSSGAREEREEDLLKCSVLPLRLCMTEFIYRLSLSLLDYLIC
ncbi:hypothetical protein DPMN_023170 [Dreissena polymorpha]|uniref:Uncharacterized protein n=1 Tax=Dreissena polymorpha TaxID=45954 RepID=A0A9D4LLL4_DREPO|nr:hypothetical protein DPMN_023170 [Dreissena polymorpha]